MLDTTSWLRKHVYHLAGEIGERSAFDYAKLERARNYIEEIVREIGYEVTNDVIEAGGHAYRNVIADRLNP